MERKPSIHLVKKIEFYAFAVRYTAAGELHTVEFSGSTHAGKLIEHVISGSNGEFNLLEFRVELSLSFAS